MSKKHVRTIRRIPDDLWNEIKNILPDEKPKNTIGCPIVPYKKYFEFIAPDSVSTFNLLILSCVVLLSILTILLLKLGRFH